MKDVYQALWREVEQVPEDMVILAEKLKELDAGSRHGKYLPTAKAHRKPGKW